MKPVKTARKLHLHRESLRQMTPRPLSPAELVQVVGGVAEPEAACEPHEGVCPRNSCAMTSF